MAGTKIKGIYKGFKFISQIFVVKEREMEIGYPTDVKHVAHVGWDAPSGNAPSWMNEFKTPPDFSTTTLSGNPRDHNHSNSISFSPWSSQDFEQSTGQPLPPNVFRDSPPLDPPNIPKKPKRKKKSSFSSPKSATNSSRSTTRRSSKTSFHDFDSASTLQI